MPLYQRAKAHIVSQIASGKWRPNARIMSEHELAGMFGISRMTANRAMTELASEGHVVRIAGVGTFVAAEKPHGHLLEIRNIADEIVTRGHEHQARVVVHESVPAPPTLAVEFGLRARDPMFHSVVVHMENGKPIQVEDRYVNPKSAPGYLRVDLTRRTANEYLTEVAPLAIAEHVVSAVTPSREIARLLQMKAGEPALLLHRRTWSQRSVASTADLYHPGTRYSLAGRFRP